MLSFYAFVLLIPIYYISRWIWESFHLSSLHRRAVLITGCDSGFGYLSAKEHSENGIPVFAGCFTQQAIDDWNQLKQENPKVFKSLRPFKLDITNDESVNEAVRFVTENLIDGEYLWALINNAGIFTIYGPDDWLTVDHYQHAFEINFKGLVRMTHAFKPLLKASRGRIINVSSTLGRVAFPFTLPYSCAKFATESYTDGIRRELYQYGVSVCLIEPGAFYTPIMNAEIHKKRVQTTWDNMDEKIKEEYGEKYKDEYMTSWTEGMKGCACRDFSLVTNAYIHATTSKYPRYRYHCGPDTKIYIPSTFLPTLVQDWLIYTIFKTAISRKMIPAVLLKSSEKKE